MITVSLRDENIAENAKAIIEIRKSNLFSDEEIQKMYDEQIQKDEVRN